MKISNLLLPFLILSSQANATTATSIWNNEGGNAAHTGYVDIKTNPSKFKVVWNKKFATKQYVDGLGFSNPTITDHMMYVIVRFFSHRGSIDINGLYALNTATGKTVWYHHFNEDENFTSSSVFDNGKVYWFSGHPDKYQMTAVDAETGSLSLSNIIANQTAQSEFSTPVMFDHHFYLGDDQGFQYSVSADTGNVDWVVPAGDDQGDPTVSDNYIFRNNYPGIDIINRQTGEKFFIKINDNPKYTESTPLWDEKNKTLYAVTRTFDSNISELTAIDVTQRIVKWKLAIKGYLMQPRLADDIIYISDFSNLYEINAINGKINWSTSAGKEASDMLVTSDVVFVSPPLAGNTVAISRKTHEVVWSYGKVGSLSMDNNRLYLMSSKDYGKIEVTAIALN